MQAYWKERKQAVTLEEVVFICQPLKDDLDVWIIKTEYWELNKNSHHKKYVVDYRLDLPFRLHNSVCVLYYLSIVVCSVLPSASIGSWVRLRVQNLFLEYIWEMRSQLILHLPLMQL